MDKLPDLDPSFIISNLNPALENDTMRYVRNEKPVFMPINQSVRTLFGCQRWSIFDIADALDLERNQVHAILALRDDAVLETAICSHCKSHTHLALADTSYVRAA